MILDIRADKLMKNQIILTPFFLDESLPELENPAAADWVINKPELPDSERQHRMSAIHRPLAEFVCKSIEAGHRPISIAGDCCTAIGMLAGLQQAGLEPVLIWFDAHGDFNTWETSPSGFLGGMPLAMLVGIGEQTMLTALKIRPLSQDRVVLTDARDLDPGEKILIEKARILKLADVRDLLELTLPDAPIYIHLDTDIINPADAPAMNYPAAGGPTAGQLQTVMKHLNRTGKIAAVSVSTWNPKMDDNSRTRNVCMGLLDTLINN
jgi:arginase